MSPLCKMKGTGSFKCIENTDKYIENIDFH